jgi:hypothetical protein
VKNNRVNKFDLDNALSHAKEKELIDYLQGLACQVQYKFAFQQVLYAYTKNNKLYDMGFRFE